VSAKDTTVNIRVDSATKARWVEAAGGPRRLSPWLTELANAASSPDAAEALIALGAQAKLVKAALPLVTPVIPTLPPDLNVGTPSDAAPADQGSPGAVVSGTGPDTDGGVTAPSPGVVEQESSGGQCPRWMHHRKGVYCGTCRKVN
jgi:hypothetical protein